MLVALLAAAALADVPPPGDYVETCTIAIQCGEIEGKICDGLRSQDPPEPECDALAAEGWARMCSSWGGTVYDVVMCKEQPPAADVASRVAAAEKQASAWCATAGFGAPLFVIGLGALMVRRRR